MIQNEQPLASSSGAKLEPIAIGGTGDPTPKRRHEGETIGLTSKLRKKAITEGENPVIKRGKRRDLSLLHAMPFDVVYEILSCLAIKDVLSVSRVSREWCHLLTSRGMNCLWKELRLGEGVPEPHPDISESNWAVLLFGGFNCEVCGTKGIQAPDFGIRRRVCVNCKKNHLVPARSLKSKFPQYDPTIAQFLPYTMYNGSWMHSRAKKKPFYWSTDIEEFGETWKKLQVDIRNEVPGAQTKADEFEARRKLIVSAIETGVQLGIDWCKDTVNKKFEISQKRKEEIFTRLRALGYHDRDLSRVEYQESVNQKRDLTDRMWKKIQPELESILQPYRRNRLVRESGHLFEPAYKAYIASIKPTERTTIPTLEELFPSPVFDRVAFLGDGPSEDDPIFHQIAGQLPELIAAWQEDSRTGLRKELLSRASLFPQDATKLEIDILDSAYAVSRCPRSTCMSDNNGVVIGWESTVRHRACWPMVKPFHSRVCTLGNPLVTKLIRLAGLNPATATCDDMDASELRVLCTRCRTRQRPGWSNREEVFTWRHAIAHSIRMSFECSTGWTVVDSNRLECIWEEHRSSCSTQHIWSCNHCYNQMDNRYGLAEAKEHLKSLHNISRPLFPDDLFAVSNMQSGNLYHPGFKLMLHTPDASSQPGCIRHGRFVCNYCSHCTFGTAEVEEHIRDSHRDLATFTEKDYHIRKYWRGWAPPPNFEYS